MTGGDQPSTVTGMATRKVTVSLDATALSLAAREGLSLSAWLSRAARREAVGTGAGPVVDGLADAVADEAELSEALRDQRAAG